MIENLEFNEDGIGEGTFLSSFFVFSPCALATADVAFGKVLVKYLFGFKI